MMGMHTVVIHSCQGILLSRIKVLSVSTPDVNSKFMSNASLDISTQHRHRVLVHESIAIVIFFTKTIVTNLLSLLTETHRRYRYHEYKNLS